MADDPRVQERLADSVQARLVAQRPDEDLQALPERVVAEVVQAGLRRRLSHQVLGCRHWPPLDYSRQ